MKSLNELLSENLNFIIRVILVLVCIFAFTYFITPKVGLTDSDKSKLDSLANRIETLTKEQQQINSNILEFESKVKIISDSIGKIKNEKIIIRKIYHEKIISVVNFNDAQIDSFFAEKYGRYYPR